MNIAIAATTGILAAASLIAAVIATFCMFDYGNGAFVAPRRALPWIGGLVVIGAILVGVTVALNG